MANKELVDYLLSIQHYNCSRKTINDVLRNAGWADKEIEDAFNMVHGIEQAPSYAWLKAGTVMALLVIALVFGVSTSANNITGNVVGVRQESSVALATEPELAEPEVTVMEEVEVPAAPAEELIEEKTEDEERVPTLEECEKMRSGEKRDECMEHHALEMNDERLCERISDAGMYSVCTQTVAIETREPELCHKLTNTPGCLTEYAKQTGDKSACKGIPNHAHREACSS